MRLGYFLTNLISTAKKRNQFHKKETKIRMRGSFFKIIFTMDNFLKFRDRFFFQHKLGVG